MTAQADRPNILILMTDQQRADCLGCAGHRVLTTPNLDRLASEGTRFEGCHTTSPVCQPARSGFLSGLYCHNHGQWNNVGRLTPGMPTMMTVLRDAGYHTCHVGKAHLHPHHGGRDLRDEVGYMNQLGFTDVLETTGPWGTLNTESIMSQAWRERGLLDMFRDDYRKRKEHRKQGQEALWPSPMPEGETIDDFIGRTAVDYLRDYARPEPFCAFVGFSGPHEPWDPPASWLKRYESLEMPEPLPVSPISEDLPPAAQAYAQAIQGPGYARDEWNAIRQLYYAKISHIDAWVGTILRTLEGRGALDNTFIVFWSDHGERLCDRGALHKQVFYDESVRVPLILRRPDGQGAGTVAPGLCEIIDVMPTLLEVGGGPSEDCIGTSLLPATRDPTFVPHDAVFSEIDWFGGRSTMVRTDRHKMVLDDQADTLQLFDLIDDPLEMHNLAGGDHAPPIESRLRERILRWRLATDRTIK